MKCLFFSLSKKLNQQCCQIRESFGCFPISILFAEIEFRRYIIILWRQKQHTHAHHFLLSTFKQMRVCFVYICFFLLFLFFFLNSSERDDCCVFQHWLHTILSFSVNGDNVTLMLNGSTCHMFAIAFYVHAYYSVTLVLWLDHPLLSNPILCGVHFRE